MIILKNWKEALSSVAGRREVLGKTPKGMKKQATDREKIFQNMYLS